MKKEKIRLLKSIKGTIDLVLEDVDNITISLLGKTIISNFIFIEAGFNHFNLRDLGANFGPKYIKVLIFI